MYSKILSLDLGTTTGYATRTKEGDIVSGTHSFKTSRFEGGGMRFLRFTFWLDQMKECLTGIDAVYFEEVRRHIGTDAAHVYGGFMSHLTSWCERNKVPYMGVPVQTIKKHITGKGNANKHLVIQAVRDLGHHPSDDNEADAIALLDYSLKTFQGGTQ